MISFGNAASSHSGLILLKTAYKFMQIYFFWLVVQVHKLWNLKTMPLNNEDAHYCKHKIWWENWLYLRPYLKTFLVFNVLETCRVFVSHGFLKNAKFVGMDQITFKNCNKSSWIQVSKILLTRNRPEQFPSFFFFNGIKPLWDDAAFPKLIIFLKCYLIVWTAYYFTIFMILLKKLHFKIFWKWSHRICSNFAMIEAIMADSYSLKRFLLKTPGTVTEKLKDK